MKFLLSTLIWVSVGFGAISAVTAYFIPTTLDPEVYRADALPDGERADAAGPEAAVDGPRYLTLASPAGPLVPRDGEEAYAFPAGTELTPEVLGEMSTIQDDGEPLVDRVHVGEFSWARWSHKWWFIGSIILLALCGLGQRALSGEKTVKKGAADPVDSIDSAIAELEAILAELPGLPTEHDRLHVIVHRVGELQQSQMANFAEAREVLIARHGMGRFAEIMDAFAGAERKVNRGWSAAADHALGESVENLEAGIPLLKETRKRMG
jgi:hypothetical protein